jgi:hypothetical protein
MLKKLVSGLIVAALILYVAYAPGDAAQSGVTIGQSAAGVAASVGEFISGLADRLASAKPAGR